MEKIYSYVNFFVYLFFYHYSPLIIKCNKWENFQQILWMKSPVHHPILENTCMSYMYVCAVYTDTKLRVVHYIQIGLNHLCIDPTRSYIKVNMATRRTIRQGLMLLWFKDLMNVTKEVIIHRPNISTLLSSAFIRGDPNAARRGPFIPSLISCLFF